MTMNMLNKVKDLKVLIKIQFKIKKINQIVTSIKEKW
jgi:hypothetical protein